MDKQEAIELLKTDVAAWNAECQKIGKLPCYDLSGANLWNANLEHANLRDATLEDALLRNSELRDTNLQGANLRRADLRDANLQGANLQGANMNRSYLVGVILTYQNLQYAKLEDANLEGADLQGADLKGANLVGSNLEGSNLEGANLSSANLVKVNLRNTNLTKAKFNDARLWSTIFDSDLSSAIGLELCSHSNPSTVGIRALTESKGQIPDVFLQGCGVPDSVISYQKSFSSTPFEFFSCFISYSHEDKLFAQMLHDQLQCNGIRCWLDSHEIKAGEDIYHAVDRGVRLWDKVLLCASKDSLSSWWVEREIETALEREMDLHKERGEQVLKIVPLNLDGSLFKWQSSHAATMKKRLAPDFTNWKTDKDKFEASFAKVLEALKIEKSEPPKPKL